MPPVRQKPDPLLAAPKVKKDPFKVSQSTSVDLLTELSLAKEKFDSDRQARPTTHEGTYPLRRISLVSGILVVWKNVTYGRKHYGVDRIRVSPDEMHGTNNSRPSIPSQRAN